MKRIKGVIFDIDGTLADSLWAWGEADRILLERRGLKYTESISETMKAMHFISAAEYLCRLFDLPETPEELGKEITDIVRDIYFHKVQLMPYAVELLDLLDNKSIKYCAATSNNRELAEGMLLHNGILDRFSFLITSDEVGSGKEDPTIFHMCCSRLDTKPDETMVIEDSPHAAQTAKKAGFFTVGVNSGYFNDYQALAGCTDMLSERLDGIINASSILFG